MITRIVEGKPIRVEGRELIPLVRVRSRVRRRAIVGTHHVAGQGSGSVCMRPIAILERGEAGERRLPIHDRTAQVLAGVLVAMLLVPLLAGLAVRLLGLSPLARRGGSASRGEGDSSLRSE